MPLSLIAQKLDHQLTEQFGHFLAPNFLGKMVNILPLKFNQKIVEFFLNQTFKEQIEDGDFEFLYKKNLLIELIDAQIFVGISFENESLVCTHFDSVAFKASATLSLPVYSAIQLIEQSVDPDTLFFQRKLKINGNTELAHQAKNTIDTLDQARIPSFVLKIFKLYKDKFALNIH